MSNINILNGNVYNVDVTEYILDLFAKTQDGKTKITYYPDIEPPYTLTHEMDWTLADAKAVAEKTVALIAALTSIGKLHDEIEKGDELTKLLNKEEISVYNTYIRDFDEPFEVDDATIGQLLWRSETETLSDEENDLLERHWEWFRDQSLKRLPFVRCNPMHVINRAKRYEHLIHLDAPQIVLNNEARCLAEQMVLYYCGKKEDC